MPETVTSSTLATTHLDASHKKLALACTGFLIITASVLAYSYRQAMPPSLDYLLVLAVASIVILLGMAGLYYYAYNFYHDQFYLFVSLGWLANAIYIVFEGFFPGVRGETEYSLWIDLFMIVSLIPFYIAGTLRKDKRLAYSTLILPAIVAGLWFVIRYLPVLSIGTKLTIITSGVSVFAFYCLKSSGKSLSMRLNPAVHGRWARRLVFTFYGYAYLQFLYLITLVPQSTDPLDTLQSIQKWALRAGFGVALFLKILNSVSALSIIRHDFSDLRVKLIRSEEQLSRQSRFEQLGILSAGVLHEIRNPLGVIETRLNLMRDSYQKSPEILEHLESIEEQRQKILYATRIIPYIRAEPEFYGREMEKTNIGDLIRKSVKDLRAEISLSTITVRFENKDEVFFARALPHMLEEAFINIMKNSVEAIRDASRKESVISIEMRIVSRDESVMAVDFKDNGVGIPPENISKVTTPLFSTHKREKPNSGLGLFITDQIIRIHSGYMEIKSEVGVGTTVSLVFPMLEFRKRL